MFNNAKFGDKFKTRNGQMALYLWKRGNVHSLQLETDTKPNHWDNDGKWYGFPTENALDIISIW